MIDIGERFKYFRNLNNVSANRISKELKVDPSTISKIENNSALPSIQLLQKFCDYLGITLRDFFDDGGAPVISTPLLEEILRTSQSLPEEQQEIILAMAKAYKGNIKVVRKQINGEEVTFFVDPEKEKTLTQEDYEKADAIFDELERRKTLKENEDK